MPYLFVRKPTRVRGYISRAGFPTATRYTRAQINRNRAYARLAVRRQAARTIQRSFRGRRR